MRRFVANWAGSAKLPILSKFFVQEDSRLFVQEEADITVRGIFLRELLLGFASPPPKDAGGKFTSCTASGYAAPLSRAKIDFERLQRNGGNTIAASAAGALHYPRWIQNKEHTVVCNGDQRRGDNSQCNKCQQCAALAAYRFADGRISGRVELTDATLDGDLES